uniref:Sushi domain-containing protein n=1 Tax=Ciona savignyi TaxID=51511 RepID=H2ZF56_CIOSA
MIVTPSSRRQAVCGPTGLFSTPPPTCRMPEVAPRTTTQAPTAAPIRCGRPPVPVNGALISVAANQITFAPGTRVFITCNQGYQLTGDNSVVCLPTGRWSATITLCSLPTQQPDTGSDTPCYSPIAPVNGGVSPEGDFTWNTGDRVTYTCNPGFVLTEPAVQTCLANGRFSNNPPECVRPSGACPPPPVPFGGSVDKPNLLSYPVGIVITYTCNDGYSMFGSSTITCQSNRQYQPPAPQCTSISRVNPVQPVVVPSQRPVVTIVTCPPPPGLQNGYISAGQKNVYTQGDVVTFSCNQPLTAYREILLLFASKTDNSIN